MRILYRARQTLPQESLIRKVLSQTSKKVSSASLKPSSVIDIHNATFYRRHPSEKKLDQSDPSMFKDLTFQLKSSRRSPEYWAILGPSNAGKSSFLKVLRGQFLCDPPAARSYPYLNSEEILEKDARLRNPDRALRFVGFGNEEQGAGQQIKGAYLSARYESFKDVEDWSVMNYLQGKTSLNPDEAMEEKVDEAALQQVIKDLQLQELIDMPVANLSNGQTRRAKIAKALLGNPEVLLLDEPFMGLDPTTVASLSSLLHDLARASKPRVILSLRPQDPMPDWITHCVLLQPHCKVAYIGTRANMPKGDDAATVTTSAPKKDGGPTEVPAESKEPLVREPVVEMEGVHLSYGSKAVLGNWKQKVDGEERDGLWWTARRGERWGIFGPNGSGKTTILALICSDHPKTYALPIKHFGKSRLPEPGQPGMSVFDLQSRIGHSSPEIHHFIPRSLTLRRVLESAWAETFKSKPLIGNGQTYASRAINRSLQWFASEFDPSQKDKHVDEIDVAFADKVCFGQMPFVGQRLAMFLRAIIKKPDIVILDEAFSGFDEALRDKCMLYLQYGERRSSINTIGSEVQKHRSDVVVTGLEGRQTLFCISHVREEIPGCVRDWICLPEANTGNPARFGKADGPIAEDSKRWNEIWGV